MFELFLDWQEAEKFVWEILHIKLIGREIAWALCDYKFIDFRHKKERTQKSHARQPPTILNL